MLRFLTRSGVLGDTSVHSFVSPGPIVYKLLLIFMAVFFVLAIVALFIRLNKIKSSNINFEISSREFIVSLGSHSFNPNYVSLYYLELVGQ